jgi:CRISPR/Cas system-associated exonuclease Cas4 (RecB family)
MSYKVIRASELGEYIYCRRAWWLRRSAGHEPLNVSERAAGVVYHEQHGQNVQSADRVRRIALFLIFLAVGAIVFWLVQFL